jgi:hypothetical protein
MDLSRVAPVIGDGIDPRLAAMLEYRPDGVRLIFAGPDPEFLGSLKRIYRVPFVCNDALVTIVGAHILVTISGTEDADGLLIDLALCRDGSVTVTPALSFTSNRSKGARQRLRPKPGFADRTIAALEGLVFRRIMPTGGIQ